MNYDAILIASFGGPESPDDIMPFLENVLRGCFRAENPDGSWDVSDFEADRVRSQRASNDSRYFWLMARGWVASIGSGETTALTKQKLKIEFRIVLVLLYLAVFGETLYSLLA